MLVICYLSNISGYKIDFKMIQDIGTVTDTRLQNANTLSQKWPTLFINRNLSYDYHGKWLLAGGGNINSKIEKMFCYDFSYTKHADQCDIQQLNRNRN